MSKKLPPLQRHTATEGEGPPEPKEAEAPPAEAKAEGTEPPKKPRARRRSTASKAADGEAPKTKTRRTRRTSTAAKAEGEGEEAPKTKARSTRRKSTAAKAEPKAAEPPVEAKAEETKTTDESPVEATVDAAEPDTPPAVESGRLPARQDVERLIEARRIVERFGRFALAGGAVPVPALDIAAVAGIQVRMLVRLARHYGVELSRDRAKAAVMALMGSVAPHALGGAAARLVGHGVPVVGTVAGMAGGGIAAHAITRVMGGLFIDHFERAEDATDLDTIGIQPAAEPAPAAAG